MAIEKRRGAINGPFLLDPTLSIPPGALSPLPSRAARRDNLRCTSKHSSVTIDLYAVAGKPASGLARGTVLAQSKYGSVTVRLVRRRPLRSNHAYLLRQHG
jgi:hypothetical protein